MMTTIEQDRRLILKAAVALSLAGPSLMNQANAGPLLWALRTGAKVFVHSVFAGIHLGIQLRPELREMHEDWHLPDTTADKTQAPESWERHVSYSLTLHIPPRRYVIDDSILVYLIDLQSGKRDIVTELLLQAPPYSECLLADLPLPALHQQGLYRFEAVIPSLHGVATIQHTNPVLLH